MLLLPFRVALVSAVAIPVTISATFGLLNAFGIELHQVSIAALIVVLGMVVDDAIVIADNYIELLDRRRATGGSGMAQRDRARDSRAYRDPHHYLLVSALPDSFRGHRRIHSRAAVNGGDRAVDVFSCRYAADTDVEPVLHQARAASVTKRLTGKKRRSPLDVMQAIYNRVIVVAMRWKTAAIAFGVIAIAAGAFVLHRLPERFFPFAERDQFVVDVWLPEGWKVEATQAAISASRTCCVRRRRWSTTPLSSGRAFRGSTTTSIRSCRTRTTRSCWSRPKSAEVTPELVRELRPRLAQAAPEARVFLSELQQGPVQLAAIEIRLTGEDEHVLRYWGDQVYCNWSSARRVRSMYTATGARMHTG